MNGFLDICDFVKEKAMLSNLHNTFSQFYAQTGCVLIMQMLEHETT
jgi:hypothetical protein